MKLHITTPQVIGCLITTKIVLLIGITLKLVSRHTMTLVLRLGFDVSEVITTYRTN
jgi:ABC-type polysaccharide transport system permease subunit